MDIIVIFLIKISVIIIMMILLILLFFCGEQELLSAVESPAQTEIPPRGNRGCGRGLHLSGCRRLRVWGLRFRVYGVGSRGLVV